VPCTTTGPKPYVLNKQEDVLFGSPLPKD